MGYFKTTCKNGRLTLKVNWALGYLRCLCKMQIPESHFWRFWLMSAERPWNQHFSKHLHWFWCRRFSDHILRNSAIESPNWKSGSKRRKHKNSNWKAQYSVSNIAYFELFGNFFKEGKRWSFTWLSLMENWKCTISQEKSVLLTLDFAKYFLWVVFTDEAPRFTQGAGKAGRRKGCLWSGRLLPVAPFSGTRHQEQQQSQMQIRSVQQIFICCFLCARNSTKSWWNRE